MAPADDERPEESAKQPPPASPGRDADRPPDDRPASDSRPEGYRRDDARAGPRGPSGDKPRPGGPPGKRPYGQRPAGRSQAGRPYGDRARGERSYGDRGPAGRPYGDRPGGPRPYGGPPRTERPYGDRPQGSRGPAERPQGDRRFVERSHASRPSGPRPRQGPWLRDQRPREQSYGQRRFADTGPRDAAGPSPAELLAAGEEVVAGRRPVEEAFAARRAAKRLLVVPDRRAALDQLVLHATTLRIPVVEVEGGTLTAISGFDGHQGVALVVEARRWATIDEVLAAAKARDEAAFMLVLDHLEDPQNVGTLLRSAEACGVHGVLFPTRGAAPISPAAVKTSAGAVEHLLLVPLPDISAGLVDLHAHGVRIVGADGGASMTVREVDLRGPVAIVVGNEGRGLHANVRKRVDLMARIPMRGRVASLNASVAGSVFLFEAAAQRDLPEVVHEEPLEEPLEVAMADSDVPGVGPADAADAPEAVTLTAASASGTAVTEDAHPLEPAETATADDALLPETPPHETAR